ncbi:hypothetical protein LCGC14_1931860 [marine sediment metagenome]|uniref:Uncharacterized protein n=1 Tax=marine sediment metagenome TaxID=412755 RepID=A0A0F9FMS0_9ZZZZ
MDHRVIGGLHPVPPGVAIHRVVAADHGGYVGPFGQARLQIGDEAGGRGRGHVAPVGDRMDRHRHARARHSPRCCQDMLDMAVNPPVRDHAHQMRRALAGL